MRAFVAIALPETLSDALARIGVEVDFGRPVPQQNLHLTLAFLDDQPDATLAAIEAELSAQRPPAPPLAVTGFDVFGGATPRVLFADVAPDPLLLALHRRVRAAVRAAGVTLPHERYRPHVTLTRISPRDRTVADPLARFLARHAGRALPAVTPVSYGLYASRLGPDGPTYEPLALYPLAF